MVEAKCSSRTSIFCHHVTTLPPHTHVRGAGPGGEKGGGRLVLAGFWRTCDFHHIVSLAVSGGVVVTSAGGWGHPWLGANTWLFSPGRRIQGAGGLSAGGGGLGRHCVPFSRLFVAAGWATGQGRVGLFWDGCSHVRIRGSFPRFPEGHGFFQIGAPLYCLFCLYLSFFFTREHFKMKK